MIFIREVPVSNCLILIGSLCMVVSVASVCTGVGYIVPEYAISLPWRVGIAILITAACNLLWAIKYGVI